MGRKFSFDGELTKKLARFKDVAQFSNCVEVPNPRQLEHFELRGAWAEKQFGNHNPLTLELACGKGEYTVGQSRLFPDRNFIGIDIKGNRLWNGAGIALRDGLTNAAFLRTHIDHIDQLFGKEEVDSIWILFADPQPGKARKRLTAPLFLDRYRKILRAGGIVHLKTDSPILYEYTLEVISELGLETVSRADSLYGELAKGKDEYLTKHEQVLRIKTYYESLWEKEGRIIKFVAFRL